MIPRISITPGLDVNSISYHSIKQFIRKIRFKSARLHTIQPLQIINVLNLVGQQEGNQDRPFLMAAGWELGAEVCAGLGNEIVQMWEAKCEGPGQRLLAPV